MDLRTKPAYKQNQILWPLCQASFCSFLKWVEEKKTRLSHTMTTLLRVSSLPLSNAREYKKEEKKEKKKKKPRSEHNLTY